MRLHWLALTTFCCTPLLAANPPSLNFAVVEGDRVVLQRYVTEYVPELRTQTVNVAVEVPETYTVQVDGQSITRTRTKQVTKPQQTTVTVMQTMHVVRLQSSPLTDVQVFETDGRPVPAASAKQRLAQPSVVLLNSEPEPASRSYTAPFRAGTLVFAPRQAVEGRLQQPSNARRSEAASSGAGTLVVTPKGFQPVNDAPASLQNGPQSVPPQIVFVARDGQGYAVRTYQETTTYRTLYSTNDQRQIPVNVGLKTRHSDVFVFQPQHLRFVSTDGRDVPEARIRERLQGEQAALYFEDSQPVDRAWLQVLGSNPLVLVGPALRQLTGGHQLPEGPTAIPATPVEAAPPPPLPPPAAPAPPSSN